jgi:retron-type reverse transcriptase
MIEPDIFAPGLEGGVSLEDVFTAYFECRKHKRNTYNALAFEIDYERKCVELWEAINNGSYRPERSIVFIVDHPVTREVFAPSFESRVVDHLIAMKITPLLENVFIDDNYATRKGKGTHYGIHRIANHIYKETMGYTQDAWVMKLDIKAFFMHLNKISLVNGLTEFIEKNYTGADKPALLFMLRVILMDKPQKHCVRKCPKSKWRKLPKDKSLFYSDGKHGLPIGRLTSQLSAAFTLNELDHLITEKWGVPKYGRYVDDMCLVAKNKELLLRVQKKINGWLSERGFTLHPKKIYLQHYAKGVTFIGGHIMPGRIYASKRSVGFAFTQLLAWNKRLESGEDISNTLPMLIAQMNSYLGMFRMYNNYNMRSRFVHRMHKDMWKYVFFTSHYNTVSLRRSKNIRVARR